MAKEKRRKVIASFIIVCLIVIAVCNVFIYRNLSDLTLAAGVILMGRVCFINLWKGDQAQ